MEQALVIPLSSPHPPPSPKAGQPGTAGRTCVMLRDARTPCKRRIEGADDIQLRLLGPFEGRGSMSVRLISGSRFGLPPPPISEDAAPQGNVCKGVESSPSHSSSRQMTRRTILTSASRLTRMPWRSRADGCCVSTCMNLVLATSFAAHFDPHQLGLNIPEDFLRSFSSWAIPSHRPPRLRNQ